MKNNILILFAFILLISCRKEDNENSAATFITREYDSLVVKSYDSIVCYDPMYGEHYCRYYPEQNQVSFPLDIDQDTKYDFSLEISHYLYSQSPHAQANIVNVTIVSLDTNYRIAETYNMNWPDLLDFKVGDTINSAYVYREDGSLVRTGPFVENYILSGNIHIGFRKGLDPSSYRYGHLNLVVDGARIILIKSVLNTNKDMCVVAE
jgi:hypothetical protein